MQAKAQHIRGFLQGSDAVAALLLELQRREALLERVRSLLPASIAPHCTQATLEHGQLTLSCDSPTWVDRLRFLSPQFLPALAEQGEPVATCRVRAQPLSGARQEAAQQSPTLGSGDRGNVTATKSGAITALEDTAAALGDTPLAASLRRLAGSLRCVR